MTKTHNKQSGFTLVELAIVMIIIGLLIGGILKGQELIANAQTTATIAQIKSYDGALSTFNDKYSALPGDMANPATRLSNCTAAPCTTVGNGTGTIGGNDSVVVAPAIGNEGVVAFAHMAAADLISGIDTNGGILNYGSAVPEAEIGGGFIVGYEDDTTITAGMANVRRGHYLVVKEGLTVVADGAVDGITAINAGRIDRKLDDGNANTGDVRATGAVCEDAVGDYLEGNTAAFCDTVIRIQS